MRAIDFHVHLPTPDWLDGSMNGYVEAAEAYFRSTVERQSLGELADKYRALDVLAVLLAWDAETATGRPRQRPPRPPLTRECEFGAPIGAPNSHPAQGDRTTRG